MTDSSVVSVPTGIAGLVAAVPANVVVNSQIAGADRAALFTGVSQRRHVGNVNLLDLELAAARRLMSNLGWEPETVDTLVHVTQTPRSDVPAAAYTLHEQLGLSRQCVVVPLNWSCAGYVMGLYTAAALTNASSYSSSRTLLVVGDSTSTMCDPTDSGTAPLFGDATSATALVKTRYFTKKATYRMGSDGLGCRSLSAMAGGRLRMDGAAVLKFALSNVPQLTRQVLNDAPADVILFHQASKAILEAIVRKLAAVWQDNAVLPLVPFNVNDYGNCSSASIPLLWATRVPKVHVANPATQGWRRLALIGFGGGWSWAGANVAVRDTIPIECIEI